MVTYSTQLLMYSINTGTGHFVGQGNPQTLSEGPLHIRAFKYRSILVLLLFVDLPLRAACSDWLVPASSNLG